MSCMILVDDSGEIPENFRLSTSNSNNNIIGSKINPNRNEYFGQKIVDTIAFISRLLYFRRLKLIKFYMATIFIVFVLFLLLRSSSSSTDQTIKRFDSNSFNINYSDNESDPSNSKSKNLDLAQNAQIPQLSYLSQSSRERQSSIIGQLSSLNGKANYPNNLSHLLTHNDFYRMKNINVMQVRIKEATKHSWENYRRYAWGYDMLKPRSKEADHWFNLGLTIVDSADTLIMMGMVNEAEVAIDWIENELKFVTESENSNCFELTIRILAGILSSYHLTYRDKLRSQAINFGDILLHCYDTESKIIPYSDIDLRTHRGHPPQWNSHSSLSEVASLQLEFRYLSQISGNPIYEQTTFQTSLHIHNLTAIRKRKLLPMYINPNTGLLEESIITLGARSDSYYEYLLKQYIQTGIKWLEDDYLDGVDEIALELVKHTNGIRNYTYIAEMQVYKTVNDTEEIKYFNKMDHLVCFLPGTLALGYYHYSPQASEYRLKYNLETPINKLNPRYDKHLEISMALARTCYYMYSDMGTGLSPEIATFVQVSSDQAAQDQPELQVQSASAHNILRPEFVESLFYLYHITGLPTYRDQASKIFDSFQKYSKIATGYSAISDVRQKPPQDADIDELLHKHAPDRMESFWISETLKYLYLIFCDDKLIVGTLLNHYVFNTEGHMLPIV